MESKKSGQPKITILGVASFGLACALIITVLNTFVQWIPTQASEWQGIIMLAPFILAPMGAIGGFIAFVKYRDAWAKWGVLLNLTVLFFLVLYIIVGSTFAGE